MNIEQLSGVELDCAVATCIGVEFKIDPSGKMAILYVNGIVDGMLPNYSRDWAHGGPIIAQCLKDGIIFQAVDECYRDSLPLYKASFDGWETSYRSDSLLVAVLRCLVAKTMGTEADMLSALKNG
ncbi:MAG TPA: phage protein NinX family protein [Methanosarcina sp.]|nr:phage protein NinX family protein [Methanosarcina sp.]